MSPPASAPSRSRSWALFRRRLLWVPTWRGALLLLALLLLLLRLALAAIDPYLSRSQPIHRGILVIDGWVPDHALAVALREFRTHDYQQIVTVGVPLEVGTQLARYGTAAELAADRLVLMGLDPDSVLALPVPATVRERTYNSALTFGRWLEISGRQVDAVDLLSLGPHTRRSWFAFERVLGDRLLLGSIAVPPTSYDPSHWWTTSQGTRIVIAEVIAYLYARVFRPDPVMLEPPGALREVRVEPESLQVAPGDSGFPVAWVWPASLLPHAAQ